MTLSKVVSLILKIKAGDDDFNVTICKCAIGISEVKILSMECGDGV